MEGGCWWNRLVSRWGSHWCKSGGWARHQGILPAHIVTMTRKRLSGVPRSSCTACHRLPVQWSPESIPILRVRATLQLVEEVCPSEAFGCWSMSMLRALWMEAVWLACDRFDLRRVPSQMSVMVLKSRRSVGAHVDAVLWRSHCREDERVQRNTERRPLALSHWDFTVSHSEPRPAADRHETVCVTA